MNTWAAENRDLWSWVYCWEVCLVGVGYEGSDQETASFCTWAINNTKWAFSNPVNYRFVTTGQLTELFVAISMPHLAISKKPIGNNRTLDRHLTLLNIQKDPMCSLCGEEYDTRLHLLGRCSALLGKRRKQFGKHLLVLSKLGQEHWSSLLKFAKNSKRLQ